MTVTADGQTIALEPYLPEGRYVLQNLSDRELVTWTEGDERVIAWVGTAFGDIRSAIRLTRTEQAVLACFMKGEIR